MFGLFQKSPLQKLEKDPRFKKYNRRSQDYLRRITEYIGDNALPRTLPVHKAIEAANKFKNHPPDQHPKALSTHQKFLSKMISDVAQMPFGKDLTDIASALRLYVATTKTDQYLGVFVPRLNMMCVNDDYVTEDINWYEQAHEHSEKYADTMTTAFEELTHAAQLYKWNVFVPTFTEDYRNMDRQLWSLFVEVQAKLLVVRSYLQHYGTHKVTQLHNSILMRSHYKPILETSLAIYKEHGFKEVDQNAALLRPALEAFFSDPFALDSYYSQSLNFTTDMAQKAAVPHERYIEAFGKMPYMEGNLLADKYSNIYDIIFLMPENSKLGQCFRGYFSA